MVRVGEKRYLNTLDTNIWRYYLEILFGDIIWNTFKGKPLLELPSTSFMLRPRPKGTFTGDEIIFSTFDLSHLLFEITLMAPQQIPGHNV